MAKRPQYTKKFKLEAGRRATDAIIAVGGISCCGPWTSSRLIKTPGGVCRDCWRVTSFSRTAASLATVLIKGRLGASISAM
jgi:hypothetical protein